MRAQSCIKETCYLVNDAERVCLLPQTYGLVLIKIEKHRQRENVIHAIVPGRLYKLVHVPDFRQDLRTVAISDADKSSVLIEPLLRSPVRRIHIYEYLVPHCEICSRIKRERPVKFDKLSKSLPDIVPGCYPALLKS